MYAVLFISSLTKALISTFECQAPSSFHFYDACIDLNFEKWETKFVRLETADIRVKTEVDFILPPPTWPRLNSFLCTRKDENYSSSTCVMHDYNFVHWI